MMKYLIYFVVLAATVILSGCATYHDNYSLEFSLVTTPKASPGKSSKAVKKDVGSAIAKQRAMIAKDPNNGNLFGQLSYLLTQNEQYNEAISAAKRAIELTGEWFGALGNAYQAKGRYDDALKAYKKAITRSRTGPPFYTAIDYNWLGETYMNKTDYAAAARAFRKASELDIEHNDTYLMHLALPCYRMGKYDSALSAIDKATTHGMLGMRIKINLERLYDERGWVTKTVANSCYVIEVEKGGPADKAGFKVGDELIAIDKISILGHVVPGSPCYAGSSLEDYIKAKRPGTPVQVFRKGEEKGTTVILGSVQK